MRTSERSDAVPTPQSTPEAGAIGEDVLLDVDDLVVEFDLGRGRVAHAVSNVSFSVMRGETLGIVGESGCGKSTLGKTIVRLLNPTSGSIRFEGRDLAELRGRSLVEVRARLQMIFQDPISSLNPRRTVSEIIEEPFKVWKKGTSAERKEWVSDLMIQVGIDPETAGSRRPHQFSGGQCQRISIARALAVGPELIICDEPVSALDVSVQAQVLNLLEDLKQQKSLTLVFISHDLAVVKNISDRVAVMYLGRIVEIAPAQDLYDDPMHPYTWGLLTAIPSHEPPTDGQERSDDGLQGDLPSPINPPSGCRFRTRCPRAQQICSDEVPNLVEMGDRHHVACHFPLEGSPADESGRTA